MPKWPVHIAMANKLNKTFNLDDNFIIGNVIPDIINGYMMPDNNKYLSHKLSHYKGKIKNDNSSFDYDNFISVYKDKLNNPIILGYFSHIITDTYFNEYFYENYTQTKGDMAYVTLKDGSTISGNKIERAKIKQFDYEIYGDTLIKRKAMGPAIHINQLTDILLKDIEGIEITNEEITITVDKINDLINSNVVITNKYKIFSEAELDKVFDECYYYILDILKRLN